MKQRRPLRRTIFGNTIAREVPLTSLLDFASEPFRQGVSPPRSVDGVLSEVAEKGRQRHRAISVPIAADRRRLGRPCKGST